jgi:hypothetical protein
MGEPLPLSPLPSYPVAPISALPKLCSCGKETKSMAEAFRYFFLKKQD